jgi:selenocysteine lyase/cysteine desulfurase
MTNIRSKNNEVANLLRSELDKMAGVKKYGPEDDKLRSSIVSFTATNKVSKTIVDKLGDTEIILCRTRSRWRNKSSEGISSFFQ